MAWVYGWVVPLQPDPEAAVARLYDAAVAKLETAAPTSEEQLAAYRVAISTCTDLGVLRDWLEGTGLPDGVPLDVDLRWRVLARLATLGAVDLAELDRQLDAEPGAVARVRHAGARASLPDAGVGQGGARGRVAHSGDRRGLCLELAVQLGPVDCAERGELHQ